MVGRGTRSLALKGKRWLVVRLPDIDTRFLKIPAHIFTYLLGQAERLLLKTRQ